MPAQHRLGLHDDQGGTPLPPRFGEHDPKESIAHAELWAFDGARQCGLLLTERQVLKRDRSVSAADQRERSEHDDERGQHAVSCRATTH